ncbi:MAG: hypothetical protein RL459_66 [Pseudomonadota bacterium]|jgi:DNA-binding protein H-NS
MTTLQELIAQKAAIEQKIAETRQREMTEAVTKVRAIVAEYGLTADDVFPNGKVKTKGKSTGKVAAKYRDPLSGKTWTGRGVAPKWIEGKDRSAFAIV